MESDLKEKKIDILIAPAFAMPAPPVGAHQYCSGMCILLLNLQYFVIISEQLWSNIYCNCPEQDFI